MAISWRILVDWDNDGDWDQSYEDITAYVMQANWSLGMQRPFQLTADESELTLLVDNRDRRFSPEYSGSPYYGEMLPQRKVKIQATRNAVDYGLYLGWIEAILPQAGVSSAKSATIRVVGAKQFFETSPAQIAVMEGVRSDQVLDALLKKVVAPPATGNYWAIGIQGHSEIGVSTYMANTNVSYLLNTGATTFDYVGDTWGDRTNVYEAIGDVVEAERGKFYFDRDGAAVFWDRRRLTTYTGITSLVSYASSNQDTQFDLRGRSGAGGTLDVNGTGANAGIGDLSDLEYREAQQFTPQASGTLSQFKFTLANDIGTPTGGISWEIRADNSNNPTGAVLDSGGPVSVTASAENTVNVTDGPFLDGSTKYWLVLYTQAQSTSNRYAWQSATTDVYANHLLVFSTNGGSSWTTLERDTEFEITTSAVAARDLLAQSIELSEAGQAGSVRLYLRRVGNPTGNLTVELQADSGGNPSGTAITGGVSATVGADELGTGFSEIEFPFTSGADLAAGTTYWIVLKTTDSASNADYVQWGADGSTPGYSDGEMKSQASGVWSAVSADAIFDLRSTSSDYTYTGADFVQMNYEFGSYLGTVVRVMAYPRKVDTGGGQIWTIEEPFIVRANDTKEVRAKFRDPNNEDAKVAAQGVSIGSFNVTNTGVTANLVAESSSAVITLTNTAQDNRRVLDLTLNAEKLITSYNQLEIEAPASAQVGLYGKFLHNIDLRLVGDDEYARQVAFYELNRRKEPFGAFVSVEMMPKNARCEEEMLDRTIGDRVRISENQTAQSNQNYFIIGEGWEWLPGEVRCVWYLEPANKNQYWIVGVQGFSEVGTTSKAGF